MAGSQDPPTGNSPLTIPILILHYIGSEEVPSFSNLITFWTACYVKAAMMCLVFFPRLNVDV